MSGLLFSPYKDVTINMNWNTDEMQSAVEGSDLPVVGSGSLVSQYIPKLPAITLAFATGACGSETWGGVSGAAWAAENIPQLQNANLNYVVSTGGEAGTFTCGSTAGMDAFIARYASPNLVGIDFDIEGGQTQSDIQNLVTAAAGAQSQYPNLQFSFTLATLAASDGSYGGVNSLGNEVVEAVLGSSLKNYVINLMTMDLRQRVQQRLRRCLRQLRDGAVGDPGGEEPRAHLRNPGEQDRRHPDDRPERQLQRDLHSR